jgi:hypothetical protein
MIGRKNVMTAAFPIALIPASATVVTPASNTTDIPAKAGIQRATHET